MFDSRRDAGSNTEAVILGRHRFRQGVRGASWCDSSIGQHAVRWSLVCWPLNEEGPHTGDALH